MFLTRPQIKNSEITRKNLFQIKKELMEEIDFLEEYEAKGKLDEIEKIMLSNCRTDLNVISNMLAAKELC